MGLEIRLPPPRVNALDEDILRSPSEDYHAAWLKKHRPSKIELLTDGERRVYAMYYESMTFIDCVDGEF